jgi:hypothetical protein
LITFGEEGDAILCNVGKHPATKSHIAKVSNPFREVAHSFYEGVLYSQDKNRSHGTGVNIILCTYKRKVLPSLRRFHEPHINIQQHFIHMRISSTDFRKQI